MEDNEVTQQEQLQHVDPCTVNISDLPQGNKLLKKANSKPYAAILTIFIVGILMLIFIRQAWYLGVFMIILAIIPMVVAKNYTQFEFYDDYFVIYPEKEDGTCLMVPYDQVNEWSTSESQDSSNALRLKLDNPTRVLSIPVNSASTVTRMLLKKISDKETNTKNRKEFQKKTANWKWFWQKKK